MRVLLTGSSTAPSRITASKPSSTPARCLSRTSRASPPAAGLVPHRFPDAPALYAQPGWRPPASIGRIRDPSRAERVPGFRRETDFDKVLEAPRAGSPPPFIHDPYASPIVGRDRP